MEEIKERPGYYATIPANVRYDKELCANAKLLYGELTSLCNSKGYCWARNSYFAALYDVSESTVKRWISQLSSRGYIDVLVIMANATMSQTKRRITLRFSEEIKNEPAESEMNPRGSKNELEGGCKNELYNNTDYTSNIDINITSNNYTSKEEEITKEEERFLIEQKEIYRDPRLFPDAIRDFSPSNSPAKGQYHPEGDSSKNPGVVPKKGHVSDELWRTDFEEYKKCLFNAMNEILKDAEYVSSRERYFNNIDVRLTLDKSIRDFWGTEDGWKRKKKTTKGTPNWITTLKNSFEMNKVYKPRVFGAIQEPVPSPTRQKLKL